MGDEQALKWSIRVAMVAAGLCLVLIVTYYWRTRKSFVADWSRPGIMGRTEPPPAASPDAAAAPDAAPSGAELPNREDAS